MLSACLAIAQDFKQTISELQTSYSNAQDLHIVMDVQVFESKATPRPYYTLAVDIKKQQNSYRYHFGETDMLLNGQYLIVVDRKSRQMMVNERSLQSEALFKQQVKLNLDSILGLYKDAQTLERKGQIQHYRVEEKQGNIRFVDLYVDEVAKSLARITYEYRAGQFASIVFMTFDRAPEFPSETFSASTFMLEREGKLVPSMTFKNFTINQPTPAP